MIIHLKKLFNTTNKITRNEIFKKLFYCKMIEGFLVNTRVFKMKMIGYIEKLCQVCFTMDHELSVNLIL